MTLISFWLDPEAKARGARFEVPRPGDAGYDLRASEEHILLQGQQATVATGLYLEIPDGYVGLISDRSSMALRRVYTHGGVIDSSYRGHVSVIVTNGGDKPYRIEPGDRIAQLVFLPVLTSVALELAEREQLTPSSRGEGGFGSTGR